MKNLGNDIGKIKVDVNKLTKEVKEGRKELKSVTSELNKVNKNNFNLDQIRAKRFQCGKFDFHS